jgi:hypothetical protein
MLPCISHPIIKIESIGHAERRNAGNIICSGQGAGGTSNNGLVATNETGS